MRHPLLLQGALAPLPEPPSAASEDTELSYLDSFAPGADVPSQAQSQASAAADTHRVSRVLNVLPAAHASVVARMQSVC